MFVCLLHGVRDHFFSLINFWRFLNVYLQWHFCDILVIKMPKLSHIKLNTFASPSESRTGGIDFHAIVCKISHTTHSIMWSATKPMRCSFSTWTGVFVVVVSRHRFQQKKKMNINIWIRIWKRLQSTKKEWARKRRLQNERRKYCKRLDFCEQVCCLNVHQMQTYKCFWCYSQNYIPIVQTVDWNCKHMQPYFWPIIFKWRHNLTIFAAIECDCKWKYMEFNI